jgi:hypothetical protein
VGTWHDPDLGRPIAAPLERCAELFGVDLATVREAAANVEPYIRADGARIWSLMQLERQHRPEACGRRRGGMSTADEPSRRQTRPPTRERTPRRSMTFGTTIRIARLHHPCCLSWRASDLRFL